MPRPTKGARLYWKARDQRWVIRDTGGVEFGTGCGAGDREAAERALQEYLAQKHRPDFGKGDPARVSITDVLTLYGDERAEQTERPDVVWSALPHLAEFFDGKMVAHATPQVCRAYAKWRMSQPQARFKVGPGYRFQNIDDVPRVGSQTVRRELGVLSAAFGYAHKEHKLLYPVVVTLPDKTPGRDRWLTRTEAAHLIWVSLGFRNVANDPKGRPIWRRPRVKGPDGEMRAEFDKSRHVARFILIGLYTGTRHEAILRLKWLATTQGGFVDLRSGILYRRGIGEGESAKRRTPVPLSKRLRAHMRRWRPQSVAHVVEFEGRPIDRLRRAWTTARKAAGLGPEVTPHILRHTFATWAVMDGVPFSKVAMALGTTEKVVEQVYGHHAPEHLMSVVESVSRRR
ncbi:Tyrosine recombinase XerD [Methylobacterium symbioticum]|uniref:Tyrosine recombinase XerD n=1 Tax=Methylobacterium symbioticum TaxID=2584084 RepID=A0A509EF01_9HYPH|nr:Tyrosine recombinase XerD [Methylobacterium symbioticum]